MARRLVASLVALVLLGGGSAAGDPGGEKAQVDARIGALQERAASQDRRAGVLTEELSATAGRVRELEAGLRGQQARLAVLEGELGAARARLATVDRILVAQTRRLHVLQAQYAVAIARLERHVRAIYVSDDPDLLSVVLGTTSFTDLLDNLELLGRIGLQDQQVARRVDEARRGAADARRRTRAARVEAAALQRGVAARAAEQQAVVTRLLASREALVGAQAARRSALASIRGDREAVLGEIASLQAQSARLAAAIRAAQAPSSSAVTPPVTGSGAMRWPVSGPVTSGFGRRWGRMHEGIDIAVPSGTPVAAAAPGRVIYAGWMEGYGNIVVIDHGGGVSTAYAHNSALAVVVGQTVATGTVIASSGSTGHSTGPHVHFEVRVGGSPVDPLAYL